MVDPKNSTPTVNPHLGSSFEDFAAEVGIRDEIYETAVKRVIAFQIEEERKALKLTKADMATAMGTSRSQLDRVLDPGNVEVSLSTLMRAARAVGKILTVGLTTTETADANHP